MLSHIYEKESILQKVPATFKISRPPQKIATPGNVELIENELDLLRKEDNLILQSKNYEVFLARPETIPNVLHEIGRLREFTFRKVGEGTNRAIDLDRF